MRPKKRRSMRCVYCGSVRTVKNGRRSITPISFDRKSKSTVSRYRCKDCGGYFSRRQERGQRYSLGFKIEVTRMHVEERMSYRVIAKRVWERLGRKIGPRVLCEMVNEVAGWAKGSMAMQEEFHPRWEGYLLVDDKYIRVKGKNVLSLVAADSSGDALHSELLVEPTQEAYRGFLQFIVEHLHYPLKGLITDWDEKLERALEMVITGSKGHIPHQRCLWHAMENIRRMIGHAQLAQRYQRELRRAQAWAENIDDRCLSDTMTAHGQLHDELKAIEALYQEQRELLQAVEVLFYEGDRNESFAQFQILRRRYRKDYPQVVAWIREHWEGLLMHQRDPLLPKTNNIAENLNKQFERRFKTIEAFQSVETAWNYQTLIRNYLRLKPYTDCKGERRWRNGHSPLQLCGVQLPTTDWLKLAITYT